MDRFMDNLLQVISDTQKQVAQQLKQMDKRFGDNLKVIEWQTGDKVLYRYFSDKGHSLTPKWVGPVVVVNKANPTCYQVEIKGGKKNVFKWFHSTQLKPWKGI